jgi:soluble lytic murein transglycosylase-like protein
MRAMILWIWSIRTGWRLLLRQWGFADPPKKSRRCNKSPTYDEEKCKDALDKTGGNIAAVQRALDNWSIIENAAVQNGVDPTILAAIGIRETGFRNVPESGYGKYDAGMGIFQIDSRYHSDATDIAYDPAQAAYYAANMLGSSYRKYVFSGMNPAMAVASAIRDYNASPRLTRALANTGWPGYLDVGTTQSNYMSNVVAIAAYCF